MFHHKQVMRAINLLAASAALRLPVHDSILKTWCKYRYDTSIVSISESRLVQRAYWVSQIAHAGQLRRDGTEYINHPIAVGCILSELQFGEDVVAAALLHDVVEDTPIMISHISFLFDDTVAMLVKGCTKMSKIAEVDPALDIHNTLNAIKKDWRIGVIKVADRLHNMRTIDSLSTHRQLAIAKETDCIHVPLAGYLGLFDIKNELGDRAFRIVQPQKYEQIVTYLNNAAFPRVVKEMCNELNDLLHSHSIMATFSFRQKSIHSIYRKMLKHKLESPEKVFDINALRIILLSDRSNDCFQALAVVHKKYNSILPGSIKDYISQPKENGYQSLHTTVNVNNTMVEIQIRTEYMHMIAEKGAAAHWAYKEPVLLPIVQRLKASLTSHKRENAVSSIITIVATDGCGLLVSLSAIITTHVHFILGVHSVSDDAIATFTYRVLAHNTVDLEECVASLIKHQAVKTAEYIK